MSYAIEDFCPLNPIISINGEGIELSVLNLRLETSLIENYGGLKSAQEKIKSEPLELLRLVWFLLVDKARFKNSFSAFESFCFGAKESTEVWAFEMSKGFNSAIVKSMPLIKNAKRFKEIQELRGDGEIQTPCYAKYYDAVAKRYGYSISDFYDLTMRQLHILLNTIGDESYKELETQAALQGRKLKPKMEFKDISEEQEQEQEEQAVDALAELKRKYEENKGK